MQGANFYHTGKQEQTSQLTRVDYSFIVAELSIPTVLRTETLTKYSGHLGIHECWLWVKILVWWPGIAWEIDNTVGQSQICVKQFSSRKES